MALMSNILWLVPNLPLNPVLMPCINLPPEKECRIILGETPRSVPASHSIPESSPQFTFNWRNGCPHVYWQIYHKVWSGHDSTCYLHVPPATDYTFFKKPLSTDVPAPQKGWGTPSASNSPISKVPPKLSLDDPDATKSMLDLAMLIEDDDDETFAPHKTDSSKLRETHRSSKQWGSPPAKKACTESPASQKDT